MTEHNLDNLTPGADASEHERVRLGKLKELCEAGENPYAQVRFERTSCARDILTRFDELEGSAVKIAGRIMSKRGMGKAGFCDLMDHTGKVQLYVRRDALGDEPYERFRKMDIGDIVGVSGEVFRTQKGEISVKADSVTLLSKSLLPLPEKFHGLRDQDLRYRERYVDLIVNPQVRDTFVARSRIIGEIRRFLDGRGYIEVDTPVLHTLETGAAARPFKTHHNTLDLKMYLRIELELYLKRLIVGGFDKVYEVGRIFRNEGMSPKHNPEFTMVELYEAYTDFNGMMELVEQLYVTVAQNVLGTLSISYQGEAIDLAPPWRRMTMAQAVKQYADVDFMTLDDDGARAAAASKGIDGLAGATWGDILNVFFENFVEDNLVQPTFIYDYPVEISPLAKRRADDPRLTERFEFFITRREMGNAFSELNDPIDQQARFERQVAERRAQGVMDAKVDEDFVKALKYGLPPTGGLGFGVDRLVMLLTDSPSIRDVILFPTMKPLEGEDAQEPAE